MTTQHIAAHMDRDGTVTQQSRRKQASLLGSPLLTVFNFSIMSK